MNSLSALIWPWRSSLNFLSAHSGLQLYLHQLGGFPLDRGGLQLCLFHLSGFLFCRLCQLHPGSLLCLCPGFPHCLGSSLAHRSAGLSLVAGLLPPGLALHPFPLSTSTLFIWKLLLKDGGSLFCRTFVVLLANLITSWLFTCVSCMSVTPVYISPCDPYVHCLVLSTVGCIFGCFQFYSCVFWFVFWSVYFGFYYYY